MDKHTHPFDVLNKWARMEDSDLNAQATPEAVTQLREIVSLLTEDQSRKPDAFGSDNFAYAVRLMHTLLVTSARELGDTIIVATDLLENSRPDEAIEVYERFVRDTESSFHRKIALNRLEALRKRGTSNTVM